MVNEKYIIKKQLGKGRSTVFLCEDIDFPGQEIAIKILSPDANAEEVKTFKNEFFILQKLNHPNIVKSIDNGTVLKTGDEEKDILTGSKFFTLESVEGVELLKYPGLDNEEILKDIIKQISSFLCYLHISNYIYYDLKPQNILVSNYKNKPFVKLIDLGFAQNILETKETIIRGTAEYIAPEILKRTKHDYRVDFYSLGIILYKIIYGQFPFDVSDELDIYRAHLEKEFEFPENGFSNNLNNTVKKLLNKEPSDRFENAIQILEALDIPVDEPVYKDWMPAYVFADRRDSLNILKSYLNDKTSNEVFTIRGSEGAGKTSLASEIYSNNRNAIFISNKNSLTGIRFVKYTISKIIFNETVYNILTNELLSLTNKVLKSDNNDFLDDLKSLFNNLPEECKFILILDAFNTYDNYTLEVFKNIIPILQVNKIKIILTENSDRQFLTDFIFNLREIDLTPFTEVQLNEYLEKSLSSIFPKEELKRLIMSYADLLPGSLEGFIKDIILLKILTFSGKGVKITADKKSSDLLKSSHEEIYNLRISKLNKRELETAQLISAFNIFISPELISKYFNYANEELLQVITGLSHKNIIHPLQLNTNPVFTSEGLKQFVYSSIKDKTGLHAAISSFLKKNYPGFNNAELAGHYELAGDYYSSYGFWKEELKQAEEISAYSYELKILQHITEFKLSEDKIIEIKAVLCNINFKLSRYKEALNLIEELLKQNLSNEKKAELLIIKGKCLTGLGEYQQGKEILQCQLSSVKNPSIKNQLLLEIASVEFNRNNYDEAFKICREIIEDKSTLPEEKGLTYQMLGLISFYKDNDTDSSLKYFEEGYNAYAGAGLRFRMAQMQMNIGNIYGVKGEHSKSKDYWEKSLEINRSIGNLEQEALLLGNFGIYYFDTLEFDESIKNYQKALSIFTSLGNRKSLGLIQINLGENYIITCNYQQAVESLNNAVDTFRQLQNIEEAMEAEIMLGKLCFIIGDFERLNSIIKEIEAFSEPDKLSEKYKNYYLFLNLLNKSQSSKIDTVIESLETLKEYFLQQESLFDYFACSILIVQLLIRLKKYETAYRQLQSETFTGVCKNNILFEAERQFTFGLIVEKMPGLDDKSYMDFYGLSYELISQSYITEATWRILFALAKAYSERGNAKKAKEYIKYSKAVINYIADNIKDSRARKIYLESPGRKQALEKLSDI